MSNPIYVYCLIQSNIMPAFISYIDHSHEYTKWLMADNNNNNNVTIIAGVP